MIFQGRAALAAAFVAVAALLPHPGLAADPQEVAEALAAALEAGTDGTVTIGEARADGDDVVISDLAFSGPEDRGRMVFSHTLIVAPEERPEGGFEAEQIEMSGGSLSGEAAGSIESAVAYAVTILSVDEIAAGELTQGILYETVEITGITFELEDEAGEVAIAYVEINADDVVDNVPQASSGVAEGILIPVAVFGSGPMTPQALGYEAIELEVSWEGARDPDTKELALQDLTLTLVDGGSLALSGRLGNVALGDPQDPMATMAAASGLTLHQVTVRYEDDSLARRILDAVGQTQGMSGEEYGEQLAMALPFLLGALGNPSFQAQLAAEVGAFLRNPGRLTIRLEPEEPLSGTQIMEIAGSAPHTLPDRLNVTIETAQ